MKRKLCAALNNRRGESLAGVMVAFVMLMLISAMFYQAIQLALNLIDRSDQYRDATETALAAYYGSGSGHTGPSRQLTFSGDDGSFTMHMKPTVSTNGGVPIYYFEKID